MLIIKDGTDRLTEHFSFLEMANKSDGGKLVITPAVAEFAVRGVEVFRKWIDEPMNVTSWYRTEAYNATLKGASKDSMHLRALAIDFQTPRHGQGKRFTPAQWQNIVRKWRDICLNDLGIVGGSVEIAPTWVHLDVRPRAKFTVMNHVDRQPADVYVPQDIIGRVGYIYI
jgi:hypothetical protein